MRKRSGHLVDFLPAQEQRLFHVLVCPACRERATTELLYEHGTALVLPAVRHEALDGVPCAAEASPGTDAETRLAELLRQPREHWFELLEEPRFQTAGLVELMLARSRAEQLGNPELSEHLASSAAWLPSLRRSRPAASWRGRSRGPAS